MSKITATFRSVQPSGCGEREAEGGDASATSKPATIQGAVNTPSMSEAEHARINRRAMIQVEAVWQRNYGFPFNDHPFG